MYRKLFPQRAPSRHAFKKPPSSVPTIPPPPCYPLSKSSPRHHDDNPTRTDVTGRLQNLVWRKPLSELPTDAAVVLVDGAYLLAEGPVWCSREQQLWWVGESKGWLLLLCC